MTEKQRLFLTLGYQSTPTLRRMVKNTRDLCECRCGRFVCDKHHFLAVAETILRERQANVLEGDSRG